MINSSEENRMSYAEHTPITKEEAVRIWKEAKKKEKEEKLLKSQTLK